MSKFTKRLVLLLAMWIVCGCINSFAQSLDLIVGAWNYGPAGCAPNCTGGMFSIAAGGTETGYDNLNFTSPSAGTWTAIDRFTYRMRVKNAVFFPDGSMEVKTTGEAPKDKGLTIEFTQPHSSARPAC